MENRLHLIYIPGVGEQKSAESQQRVVAHWKRQGVTAELFPIHWASNENWDVKYHRLLDLIDQRLAEGNQVGLIAASAGAAAAIAAFGARRDHLLGVVCVAGKINRPETIGAHYRKRYPALLDAAKASERALQSLPSDGRERIMSRYALADETVYKPDSRVPGAHNVMVPTIGHALTIATQITLGYPGILRFFRRLQKRQLARLPE